MALHSFVQTSGSQEGAFGKNVPGAAGTAAGAAAATAAILATTYVVAKIKAIAAAAPAATPAAAAAAAPAAAPAVPGTVHFGKTQVPLAIGTPLAQGEDCIGSSSWDEHGGPSS